MKEAVQSCTLSKKWKFLWTSMTHLNFSSQTFPSWPQFADFVPYALSHRDYCADVSAVKVTFTGEATHSVIKSIISYAYWHNVREPTLIWLTTTFHGLPQYPLSCHTLKHLTLAVDDKYPYCTIKCRLPRLDWDFPALETLDLKNIQFYGDYATNSLNPFSKCVKLKDLTLHNFSMFQVETFNICAPKLVNLTITDPIAFPKVLNVVAPHLQNLTISFCRTYSDTRLQLSPGGFDSLEKVNLSLPILTEISERYGTLLLDLFQKLHTAKFLILDVGVIQVTHKRSRLQEHDDIMAKKVAKLEARIKMQDEIIANQKAISEAANLQP